MKPWQSTTRVFAGMHRDVAKAVMDRTDAGPTADAWFQVDQSVRGDRTMRPTRARARMFVVLQWGAL